MRKFFCNGLGGFCNCEMSCKDCGHCNGTSGEYREVIVTEYDRIHAMDIQELAEFIARLKYREIWRGGWQDNQGRCFPSLQAAIAYELHILQQQKGKEERR